MGGAAGSSFISAQALTWTPVGRVPTAAPTVTVTPVIKITTPALGAGYSQGSAVTVSWSCAQFVKTVGDHVVCAAPVASGGRLDTKSVGLHAFVITDGNVVASAAYAVTPACGRLAGAKQQRCQAQTSYLKAQARCSGLASGKAACQSQAARAYKQRLAKIK
jgi:hypothetical protein